MRERFNALRIVRTVGDDGRIGAQQFEPRLPARRGKALAQRAFREAPPLFAQHAHRFDGERRVAELMLPEQVQRQVLFLLIIKPLSGERVFPLPQRIKRRRMPRRAAFGAYLPVHRVHGGVYRVRNGGRAGLDDPGLFARDLGECMAENGGVLEPDVRDNGGLGRRYHVRCVKPPAETDFEHHGIAFLRREIPEAHRGQNFKLRRCVGHADGGLLYGFGGAAKRRVGDV